MKKEDAWKAYVKRENLYGLLGPVDCEVAEKAFYAGIQSARLITDDMVDVSAVFECPGITHLSMEFAEANNKPSLWSTIPVEDIYSAYPRKKAPRAAKKAISKAMRELCGGSPISTSGSVQEYLLERTKMYAAAVAGWPKEDATRFVPYPATWFNGGCYAEDPATWVREPSKQPYVKPGRVSASSIRYTE